MHTVCMMRVLTSCSRGPPYILRLLREAPAGSFDTALLAGGWNLLNTEGSEVLTECARCGVAVHLAGVFGGTGQADNRNIFAPGGKWASRTTASTICFTAVCHSLNNRFWGAFAHSTCSKPPRAAGSSWLPQH